MVISCHFLTSNWERKRRLLSRLGKSSSKKECWILIALKILSSATQLESNLIMMLKRLMMPYKSSEMQEKHSALK